jgi:hypothetical protein
MQSLALALAVVSVSAGAIVGALRLHYSCTAVVAALRIENGFERLVSLHADRLVDRLVNRLVARLVVVPANATAVAAVVATAAAVATVDAFQLQELCAEYSVGVCML